MNCANNTAVKDDYRRYFSFFMPSPNVRNSLLRKFIADIDS